MLPIQKPTPPEPTAREFALIVSAIAVGVGLIIATLKHFLT